MKKLLMTSAVVAFAGAAAAEITWTGTAEVGYRTHDDNGIERLDNDSGFYATADVDAKASAELNYGITATIKYGLGLDYTADNGEYKENKIVDGKNPCDGKNSFNVGKGTNAKSYCSVPGGDVVSLDNFPTIEIKSANGTFTIGEVEHAAKALYKTAGKDFTLKTPAEVKDAKTGGVSTKTKSIEVGFTGREDEQVARVDGTVAGFTGGVSYVVDDNAKTNDVTKLVETSWDKGRFDDGLSQESVTIGANGEIAGFLLSFGFQNDDRYDDNGFGISTGYTWNGITGRIGYESWTFSEVVNKADGKFHFDSVKGGDDLTVNKIGLDGSYKMDNGVEIGAALASVSFDGGNKFKQDDVMTYDVYVKFKALGADVTAGFEGNDWEIPKNFTKAEKDAIAQSGAYIDASYTIEGTGVTILGGYHFDEAVALTDADDYKELGAYYVGTTYDLGGGASIFATYSNADEIGTPEYKPGARLGMKLSF